MIFQASQGTEKILTNIRQTFTHVGLSGIEFQENCTLYAFLIFVPNPRSHSALCDVSSHEILRAGVSLLEDG